MLKYLAIAAAGAMAATPCLAAEDWRDTGAAERRSSGFAGLSARVPLSGAGRAKPSARLQITTTYHVRDARSGASRDIRPAGLELGLAKAGKPAFYIGGRQGREMEAKLGIGGSTATLLVVGGVVLLVVVAAAAVADATPKPGPDEDAFD